MLHATALGLPTHQCPAMSSWMLPTFHHLAAPSYADPLPYTAQIVVHSPPHAHQVERLDAQASLFGGASPAVPLPQRPPPETFDGRIPPARPTSTLQEDPKALYEAISAGYQQLTITAKQDRLRSLKPFVLDNSIRESTVAQTRGHTPADKDDIFRALEGTGIAHIIVGSFDRSMARSEDLWLRRLRREDGQQHRFYVFSEMVEDVHDGFPDHAIPHGLVKMKEYGIRNAILEVDLLCKRTDPAKFTDDMIPHLIQSRLDFIRRHAPRANIFINYRDGPVAWADVAGRTRIIRTTQFLASLQPQITGLLFEDSTGDAWPHELGELSFGLRTVMDRSGWAEGLVLVHVHRMYGLAEAGVRECLATGANGVWAAACEIGAGLGHASYTMTLTNLARMGNAHVKEMFDFPRLYEATVAVTEISSGESVHPTQEIIGDFAHQVFSDVDERAACDRGPLWEWSQRKRSIQVSAFMSPALMRKALTARFGARDWDPGVVARMVALVQRRPRYQGKKIGSAALLQVYQDAGGTRFLEDMERFAVRDAHSREAQAMRRHPLLRELRQRFKSCGDTPDPTELSYEAFYGGFLQPYMPPDDERVGAVYALLDIDKDGAISLEEVELRALVALETSADRRDVWELHDLVEAVVQEHMVPHMARQAEGAGARNA